MFLLIGERVKRAREGLNSRFCSHCDVDRNFSRVTETNYFTLFAIPLLPLDRVADYVECDHCGTAYPDELSSLPSSVPLVQQVVAYMFAGYGMQNQVRIAQQIAGRITSVDYAADEFERHLRELEQADLMSRLTTGAAALNDPAKLQIVSAAFLAAHVCCEIQHEDRVRINLIGNAVGVSLQFVDYAITQVRNLRYYDVQRVLPSSSLSS